VTQAFESYFVSSRIKKKETEDTKAALLFWCMVKKYVCPHRKCGACSV